MLSHTKQFISFSHSFQEFLETPYYYVAGDLFRIILATKGANIRNIFEQKTPNFSILVFYQMRPYIINAGKRNDYFYVSSFHSGRHGTPVRGSQYMHDRSYATYIYDNSLEIEIDENYLKLSTKIRNYNGEIIHIEYDGPLEKLPDYDRQGHIME